MASCFPAALQAAKESNPIPLLLGAICTLLPDTLDRWVSTSLHKPDIHVVSPPDAPAPHLIAEALAHAISQSHNSKKTINIACYPMPIGPGLWIPYTIHFDCTNRKISVITIGTDPISGRVPTLYSFITDYTNTLSIDTETLAFQLSPNRDGRVHIVVSPGDQRWSHSLIATLTISVLATAFWGLTAGAIAGSSYALHVFIDQWGFNGCSILWPFSKKRHKSYQWIKPIQYQMVNFAILWLALLLIAWNIIHSATPAIESPSLLQLLFFAGAPPLIIWAFIFKRSPKLSKKPQPCINN